MNIDDAHALAEVLMQEHLGDDWTFRFDRAKQRFGACRFHIKTISLSEHLTKLNDVDQVQDTILHEIAHALAGPNAGHGRKWQQQCEDIGAKPERCYSSAAVEQPDPNWVGRCPGCGYTITRYRLHEKSRRVACSTCCQRFAGGKYSEDYRFVWTDQSGQQHLGSGIILS